MLDYNIRSSESLNVFKSKVIKFVRPKANSSFNCLNHTGVKLTTRLLLGLSQLREHKLKHSFQDCLNPLCSYGAKSKQLLIKGLTLPTTYIKGKPF